MNPGTNVDPDETIIQLANGWTLRSEAGDNVRLVEPNGTERIYWDQNEWHEDPVGVMAAIFGAASRLPASNEDFRGNPLAADNPDSVKLPEPVRVCILGGQHLIDVDDDGYCNNCGFQDGGRSDDEPTTDSAKREELATLEAEFEAAGGRGVDLADRIDALRADLQWRNAVADMPQHPRIERSGPTDAPWWVYIPPRGPQDLDTDDWSILGPYGGTYWPTFDEAVEFMRRTLDSATCKHCGRSITREDGAWVDPEATGDDAVWRETCDAQDTLTADHEPDDDDPLRKLLADWFQGELNHISEHGHSSDWQAAVDDAKARHARFSIPWDDAFVPDYVREMLAMKDDDG